MTIKSESTDLGILAHIRERFIRFRDLDVPTLALLGTAWGTLIAAIVLGIGVKAVLPARILALMLPLMGWVLLFVAALYTKSERTRTRWCFGVCFLYGLVILFPEPFQFNVIKLDRTWIEALLWCLFIAPVSMGLGIMVWTLGAGATSCALQIVELATRFFSRVGFGRTFAKWIRSQLTSELSPTLVIGTGVGFAVFTGWSIAQPSMGALRYLQTQLANLSLILIPVLLVAGSDLAEIAELGGGISIYREWNLRPELVVLIGLGLSCGVVVLFGMTLPSRAWLLAICGIVAIVPTTICHGAKWTNEEAANIRVPVRTLVILGVIFAFIDLVGLYGPTYFSSTPQLTIGGVKGLPSTAVERPVNWSPQIATANDLIVVLFVEQTWMAHIMDISPSDLIKQRPPGDEIPRAELRFGPCTGGPDVEWSRERNVIGKDGNVVGRIWQRRAEGCTWRITELTSSSDQFVALSKKLDRVRASWKLTRVSHFAEMTMVAGYLALLVLLLLKRPKKILSSLLPNRIAHTYATMFVLCGLLTALVSSFRSHIGFHKEELPVQVAILASVTTGIAVLTLASAALSLFSTTRRRALALLGPSVPLTGALVILAIFAAVYAWAAHAAKPGIVEALVIVVMISWDLLTSGDAFTNYDTPGLPRNVRVLVFAAYVVFVAGTITNAADFRIFNGPEVSFNSEAWALEGIIRLGIPYLLTVYTIRLSRFHASAESVSINESH